jgi:hypothetical protein
MLPAIAASLLTACAAVNSDHATSCLPVKEYSRVFQNQLADEVKAAPPDAAFPLVLQDCALLRAQARAGCGR